MTPRQEQSLLDGLTEDVEAEVLAAYRKAMDLMRRGTAPRDAINRVMDEFTGQYADLIASALSEVLERSVGRAETLALQVGEVSLSRRLYSEAEAVSSVVQGIVQRHVRGVQDSRGLALELFEGYGFREAEPLQISRANRQLPRYMREALLSDDKLEREIARGFARIQVNGLGTGALRAAYSELLDTLEDIEKGDLGFEALDKRLKTAFYERVRYFSNRIARTETHRAYADREARILMDDEDIEYVQIRRSRASTEPCICDLVTGRDQYGLGPGVYPKDKAPNPPLHPHCRCIQSPRLDLTGRKAKPENPDADQYFLNRLSEPVAARVVGSKAKLARVQAGEPALSVYNGSINPTYRVKTLGEAANAYSTASP